jgi:hypothetical protein
METLYTPGNRLSQSEFWQSVCRLSPDTTYRVRIDPIAVTADALPVPAADAPPPEAPADTGEAATKDQVDLLCTLMCDHRDPGACLNALKAKHGVDTLEGLTATQAAESIALLKPIIDKQRADRQRKPAA